MTAATVTRELSQTPPLWDKVTSRLFDPEEVTPAIMRMQTEKWWKGRLRRVAASWREHLQIALANVSKKAHLLSQQHDRFRVARAEAPHP